MQVAVSADQVTPMIQLGHHLVPGLSAAPLRRLYAGTRCDILMWKTSRWLMEAPAECTTTTTEDSNSLRYQMRLLSLTKASSVLSIETKRFRAGCSLLLLASSRWTVRQARSCDAARDV